MKDKQGEVVIEVGGRRSIGEEGGEVKGRREERW